MQTIRLKRYSIFMISLFLLLCSPWGPLADAYDDSYHYPYEDFYAEEEIKLEIIKSEHLLYVKRGDKVIREFWISLGDGGLGDKRVMGDKRTPEGEYRIHDFNFKSKYFFFISLDYPNLEDAEVGFIDGIISFDEYRRIKNSIEANKMPPQDTALGGNIGIHGVKPYLTNEEKALLKWMDWTKGCIALSNDEIQELLQYSSIGTKVIIRR